MHEDCQAAVALSKERFRNRSKNISLRWNFFVQRHSLAIGDIAVVGISRTGMLADCMSKTEQQLKLHYAKQYARTKYHPMLVRQLTNNLWNLVAYIRILYTCIISIYMIETRDSSCPWKSHSEMQAVTWSIVLTHSSASTISFRNNTKQTKRNKNKTKNEKAQIDVYHGVVRRCR